MDSNNIIYICGRALSDAEYSHTLYGEAFFKLKIAVERLSGTIDIVPVTVGERLLNGIKISEGAVFSIAGQIRSYNKSTETGSRLIITVFAREFLPVSDDQYGGDCNECELSGFICKPVVYRTTPFSREIADVLLAVNRRYGKSDYLPCIAWGRNARFLSNLNVGEKLNLTGRLQSREYKKLLPDGTTAIRTAYEVSCSTIETSDQGD